MHQTRASHHEPSRAEAEPIPAVRIGVGASETKSCFRDLECNLNLLPHTHAHTPTPLYIHTYIHTFTTPAPTSWFVGLGGLRASSCASFAAAFFSCSSVHPNRPASTGTHDSRDDYCTTEPFSLTLYKHRAESLFYMTQSFVGLQILCGLFKPG